MKALTVITLIISLALGPTTLSYAQDLSLTRSLSHPDTLELALQDYYAAARNDQIFLNGYASDAFDLNTWAEALASEIAQFNPSLFNNLLVLLAIDYCQMPELKSAVELLAKAIRQKAENEINPPHWAHTVIQDALWVWAFALGILTVKSSVGKWRKAGHEVTRLKRSWGRIKSLVTGYPEGLVIPWILPPLAGSAAGAAHAFINTFRMKKLDPLQLLADLQCDEKHQLIELPVIAGHPRSEKEVLEQLGIDPKQREELKRLRLQVITGQVKEPKISVEIENTDYESALSDLLGTAEPGMPQITVPLSPNPEENPRRATVPAGNSKPVKLRPTISQSITLRTR